MGAFGMLEPYEQITRQLIQIPNPWDHLKFNAYCGWIAAYWPEQILKGNVWEEINGQRAPWHASRFSDAWNKALSEGWQPPTFGFDSNLNLLVDNNSINTINPNAGPSSGGTEGKPVTPGKVSPYFKPETGKQTFRDGNKQAGFSVLPIILIIAISVLVRLTRSN